MSLKQTIAIDAMGGDEGPRLCVPATLKFLQTQNNFDVCLFGKSDVIEPLLPHSSLRKRITLNHCDQVVEMGEVPGSAYRHKRSSSMWCALEFLADGHAQACVSAGNTGALMAMSRHLVTTVDGMKRPAICKPVPTIKNDSYLLDLGANLNCSPEQLLAFALMGSALAQVCGCSNPRVALMNVGAETSKGHQEIKEAFSLMEAHPDLNFQGFIEGNNLYSGVVDVVVCDGFVGNVALKVSEGAASFILDSLRQEFSSSAWRKILGVMNRFALKRWHDRFNPSKYNGAALLGLKKVVIKSHGGADALGFYEAICTAQRQIDLDIPQRLEASLRLA
ncbi:MAG: phosphate acyltransferase PlsX [Agarilytica sp.]